MQGNGWGFPALILKTPVAPGNASTFQALRGAVIICRCAARVWPWASCSFSAPARASTSLTRSLRRRLPVRRTGAHPVPEAGAETRAVDRVVPERAATLAHRPRAAPRAQRAAPRVTPEKDLPEARPTTA